MFSLFLEKNINIWMIFKSRKIRQPFIAFFSAFLLLISSCTVKNVLADAFGIQYSKPLSPSKTSDSQQSVCHYTHVTVTANNAVQKEKLLFSRQKNAALITSFTYRVKSIYRPFSFTQKIHRYILYKKIKYHLR